MKQNQFNRINNKSKSNGMKFFVAIFLLVVVVPLFFSNFRAFKSFLFGLKELKNTKANLGSLKLREEKLNKDLDSLKHDYGIEKEIRERFPVAKEGEEVIIFVDSKEKNDSDNSNINQSFWNKFKDTFGF